MVVQDHHHSLNVSLKQPTVKRKNPKKNETKTRISFFLYKYVSLPFHGLSDSPSPLLWSRGPWTWTEETRTHRDVHRIKTSKTHTSVNGKRDTLNSRTYTKNRTCETSPSQCKRNHVEDPMLTVIVHDYFLILHDVSWKRVSTLRKFWVNNDDEGTYGYYRVLQKTWKEITCLRGPCLELLSPLNNKMGSLPFPFRKTNIEKEGFTGDSFPSL